MTNKHPFEDLGGYLRPYFSYRCDGRTYDVIDEDDFALYLRQKRNPLHQITILK